MARPEAPGIPEDFRLGSGVTLGFLWTIFPYPKPLPTGKKALREDACEFGFALFHPCTHCLLHVSQGLMLTGSQQDVLEKHTPCPRSIP